MVSDDDSSFVTNRHFEREIATLRDFAKSRMDASDRAIAAQGEYLNTRFDNLARADAAVGQHITTIQSKLSDVIGRLDRAEGGTARHSATIAMAVSISAVIMSLVVGGLSIVKTSTHPDVVYKDRPQNPPYIDGS